VQVKVLERGIKYGTCSEADKAKLEKLRKQLEAQKEKQRLALDKVCYGIYTTCVIC
jgi:hypothetical protein